MNFFASPSAIVMYAKGTCPYCIRADALLRSKGITDFKKIRIDLEPHRRAEMIERTGRSTVPQIYIGDKHIGGCDDLHALDSRGELDRLLAETALG
jgi:glutaredoxin 3